MIVYAKVNGISDNIIGGAEQLTVTLTIAFDNSGTAENTSTNAYIGSPNLATGLLIDNKLRATVRDYVNSTYGLSISSSDVILSGGFNIPLI